jgi:uncharacterized protein (TIGR00369 family)
MIRTRTYSWGDAQELAKASRGMTGLEFNHFLMDGGETTPIPMFSTMGFRFAEVEHGRIVIVGEVGEHLYNPIGVVHGGVAATLLDSVAASAVHSVLPAGTSYTSLDLSVKFLRPILADTGTLRAIGTVITRGTRTALAQAELRDPADRLLAHATSSCMLYPTDT